MQVYCGHSLVNPFNNSVGRPYKYIQVSRVSPNNGIPLLSLADVPSRLTVSDSRFYPEQSASGIRQNQH